MAEILTAPAGGLPERTPAIVSPPSTYILEMLVERGWTVNELQARMFPSGRAIYAGLWVNAAIWDEGTMSQWSRYIAPALARAFGVSEQFWVNIYTVWKAVEK